MSTATENIDTMPAGAALDAAVAEKVMGWPTCRDPACGGDCGAPVFLTASGWHVGKPDEIEEDWSPSTNANDTMDVLAELHRQGCGCGTAVRRMEHFQVGRERYLRSESFGLQHRPAVPGDRRHAPPRCLSRRPLRGPRAGGGQRR